LVIEEGRRISVKGKSGGLNIETDGKVVKNYLVDEGETLSRGRAVDWAGPWRDTRRDEMLGRRLRTMRIQFGIFCGSG
jgi:hypothetical protein